LDRIVGTGLEDAAVAAEGGGNERDLSDFVGIGAEISQFGIGEFADDMGRGLGVVLPDEVDVLLLGIGQGREYDGFDKGEHRHAEPNAEGENGRRQEIRAAVTKKGTTGEADVAEQGIEGGQRMDRANVFLDAQGVAETAAGIGVGGGGRVALGEALLFDLLAVVGEFIVDGIWRQHGLGESHDAGDGEDGGAPAGMFDVDLLAAGRG